MSPNVPLALRRPREAGSAENHEARRGPGTCLQPHSSEGASGPDPTPPTSSGHPGGYAGLGALSQARVKATATLGSLPGWE